MVVVLEDALCSLYTPDVLRVKQPGANDVCLKMIHPSIQSITGNLGVKKRLQLP